MYKLQKKMLMGGGRKTVVSYTNRIKNLFSTHLKFYWIANELLGTTAVDSTTNGNDGTYTAVTLGQPGIGDGNTSMLNGTDGAIAAPVSLRTVPAWNTSWGVGCYVKFANTTAPQYILAIFNHAFDQYIKFGVNVEGANNLECEYSWSNFGLQSVAFTSTTWNQIIITYNSVANTIICYLNGMAIITLTSVGTFTTDTVFYPYFVNSTSGRAIQGNVEHMFGVDRVITPAEALACFF